MLTPNQQKHAKKAEPQTRQGAVQAPPWPRRGVRTSIPLYNLKLYSPEFPAAIEVLKNAAAPQTQPPTYTEATHLSTSTELPIQ